MQSDPKIVLPTPHAMQTKMENKLDALNALTKNLTKEQKFKYIHGYKQNGENMFYIYLFRKYKTKCFVRDRGFRYALGMHIPVFKTKTKLVKERIAEIKLHIDVLADELVNCIKNKNIEISIIPLTINNPTSSLSSHANILIYRKKFNHIEHFEPHGRGFGGVKSGHINEQVSKMLNYFVLKVNEKLKTTKETQIKLIESSKVCPRFNGLQELEGKNTLDILEGEPIGYCLAWSFFFAELCLANPEFPSLDLLTYIYNVMNSMGDVAKSNYLRNMIRGYSMIINEKIEKYFSILYNNNLSVHENASHINPSKINMKVEDVLNSFIAIELNSSIQPNYVDKMIRLLKKDINTANDKNADPKVRSAVDLIKELEVFELYKSFDEINSDTMSDKKEEPEPPVPSPKQPDPKQQPQPKPPVPTPKCPEGKEINPLTGRCIKIKTLKDSVKTKKTATKKCPEGKELNPLTGRCINIKTLKDAVKTPKDAVKTNKTATKKCPKGKELNPLTGRCINIKTLKNR